MKDKVWFFVATSPYYTSTRRSVDFGGNWGVQDFTTDRQTYFSTARIDALVAKNLRVFGSWLYQYQRGSGVYVPNADSYNGLYNSSVSSPLTNFNHGIGFVSPNQTINVGADWTISPTLVATTRFGHFFANYADRGWPTGPVFNWRTNGTSATAVDLAGAQISSIAPQLAQTSGYLSAAVTDIYTRDADKHDQFNQDIAWFKSGLLGTHNFKAGYLLNHLSNDTLDAYNGPLTRVYAGTSTKYAVAGSTGIANCTAIIAANATGTNANGQPNVSDGGAYADGDVTGCTGEYGFIVLRDIATSGKASSYNHGLYAQDSWQILKGLTVNVGVRFDKEYLPSYSTTNTAHVIDFGWGKKFSPRIGVAWDPTKQGKMKIFGSYGVFYDVMKLNVARDSFGGSYWHNCAYALNTPDLSSIVPAYADGHYCAGTGDGTFQGGVVPSGLKFIENINYRANALELVDPNIKPYRQHETVFGVSYQIAKSWALNVTWDRRRLDHAIEDMGVLDSEGNENFFVGNPGEGVDKYVTDCASCPVNIKAARSYDGVEFRLNKSFSEHWYGLASYTYSKLRGNYAGLTNTDLADGGSGGRDNPNDNRAFDEPYFQFNSHGQSSSGPLATDRPNTFKFAGYYQLPWGHKTQTTTIGLFQQIFSGSPLSSYMDVGDGGADGGFPVYLEGRGKWIDIAQDTAGNLTVTGVRERRTAAFLQTDASFSHEFKFGEGKRVSFDANITNLFNQHAVLTYYSQINSSTQGYYLQPGGGFDYATLMSAYDYKTLLNTDSISLSSRYNKPLYWQQGRLIRLKLSYSF